MEPEFEAWIRENMPAAMLEQYKAERAWAVEWRDKKIAKLETTVKSFVDSRPERVVELEQALAKGKKIDPELCRQHDEVFTAACAQLTFAVLWKNNLRELLRDLRPHVPTDQPMSPGHSEYTFQARIDEALKGSK